MRKIEKKNIEIVTNKFLSIFQIVINFFIFL